MSTDTDAVYTRDVIMVWLTTDAGTEPMLCCTGDASTRFAEQMCNAGIAASAELVPCCLTTGDACTWDQLDDDDDRRRRSIVEHAAKRAGIVWPTDATDACT